MSSMNRDERKKKVLKKKGDGRGLKILRQFMKRQRSLVLCNILIFHKELGDKPSIFTDIHSIYVPA